ncbi:MAG: hypothetical protein J6S67_07185 [Methanobrevibacter sp.]|nr:hypothetical protein [Methanobrevibacter sp.]
MIISHESPIYQAQREKLGPSFHNGAYYYSVDIVKNIIPNVNTDRNWVTIMVNHECLDHSIYFLHNNLYTYKYNFLKNFKDVIVVAGTPETAERCRSVGVACIYLPLSIDVEHVKQFKAKRKTKDVCYAGRAFKIYSENVPDGVDKLCNMEHDDLLKEMGKYRQVYAVGRTAIEAKVLGCEVLPYDPRFPNPEIWEILDNKDAAKLLQEGLDYYERNKKKCYHKVIARL